MAEANVVLARARIAGGIRLDKEAPERLDAGAGDRLLFKLPYRFDEVSRDREDYRIRFQVQIDDQPPEEQVLEGKDHMALSDDKRGFLVVDTAVVAAGQHTVRFEATVRLEMSDWNQGSTEVQESTVEGTVALHVR